MVQKRNRAGEMQPYVPAGNGDASGEFTNKEGAKKFEKGFAKAMNVQPKTGEQPKTEKSNSTKGIITNSSELKTVVDNVNKQKYNQGLKDYRVNCYLCVQTFDYNIRNQTNKTAPAAFKERTVEYSDCYDNGWDLSCYKIDSNTDFQWWGFPYFFGKVKSLSIGKLLCKGYLKGKAHLQKKQIEDIVQQAGDGAVFQMKVMWARTGNAHVFNIINVKGKVYFVDPQTGTMDYEQKVFQTGIIRGKYSCLCRVDNLELDTQKVKKYLNI